MISGRGVLLLFGVGSIFISVGVVISLRGLQCWMVFRCWISLLLFWMALSCFSILFSSSSCLMGSISDLSLFWSCWMLILSSSVVNVIISSLDLDGGCCFVGGCCGESSRPVSLRISLTCEVVRRGFVMGTDVSRDMLRSRAEISD